jgi:hypothetical protein
VLLWVPLQTYQHLERICCSISKAHEAFWSLILQISIILPYNVGRDSLLSLHSDLLWAARSRDRIPLGGTFSAPIQTGPGSQPAINTMGTESFPGVKWPGRGVDHPPPSSAEVKGRLKLYTYFFLLAFVDCSRVNFTFTCYLFYPLYNAESWHITALEWCPPVVPNSSTVPSDAVFDSCTLETRMYNTSIHAWTTNKRVQRNMNMKGSAFCNMTSSILVEIKQRLLETCTIICSWRK